MTKSTKSWVLSEFEEVSHNDKRLDKRFVKIACDAMENPAAPINQASEDWAATKAAYRFFNNPKIDRNQILKSHQKCTIERMTGHKVVLAIQDSCLLDFTNHTKLKGKGPIGTRTQNLTGYIMHSTLAVTPVGTPLGLLTHSLWARDEIKENRSAINRTLPVEEKESIKWINAFRETCEVVPPDIEVIHLADREADFYEFFEWIEKLQQKCVIRSRFDREIEDNERMWDFMSKQPVKYTETITVSRNRVHVGGKNKKAFKIERETEVEVRVAKITFHPPSGTKRKKSLKINLVFVKEIDPPDGEEPVEWMLITNLAINTTEEISQVIFYYRLRWVIEEFHKILKTGCKVEKCYLEDTEAMFRYITLYCIIAWRLFWLVRVQRINPDAPCTEGLGQSEWRALYCYVHKTQKIPDKIPTIREAVVWIACLGGFLARKGDGEPGIITIWRGWTRLNDIIEMYTVFTGAPERENC
jgi:hypothetical protein